MCILCAIASWSRRAATMLPWLVIPFIIVWALSQLFPPGYRLEVTSPRLACLGVLLSSLGWYELLMPWLSSWQARRSALLRERKLIEAQEALKWRKEATRRCRNCLTVYKVQTPGGGRFMCTYCGHISKRPVLEVPGSSAISGLAGLPPSVSCSGGNGAGTWHLLKAVRRGSRPHGSIWSRDVERNRCACLGEGMNGADKCSMRQSFPAALMIILRILSLIEWVWRKLLGVRLPSANGSKGSPRVMEISADSNGSRGEKARRKANEKKQARLERERLEAEERKQREEVAWLVEERRRQRFKELEGAKKIESEMAGERETEARSVRDTGRRRKDKAKERITDPVIDSPAEQELGAADKTTVEIDDRVVSPVRTSVKVAESTKLAKVSRGIVQNHSLRYKSTTNNSARLGLLKHTGTSTTQRAPASAFKMGTLYQSDGAWTGKNDGTLMVRKMTKSAASVAPGSSSSSPKPAGAPYLSGSAWKRAPWISAWAKGSEHLTGDSSKTETGLVIGSGQSLGEVVDGRLKSFNDSASVVKPSLQPVRGTAIQPPIAPQLTCIDPLQQLFSTPSIFSLPVDFNNMGEQKPQSEIKASFLSEHTFFEAQACVTFQSSNSFAPPLTSPSLQMPMPVLDRMSTPLQPTLGGPENNFMRSNFLSPEAVYGLETFLAKGLTSESQSLTSVSISDPAINDNLIPLPFLDPIKVDESNPHIDQEDALRWVLPPVSLEKTDEDALQLPPSIPVQSLFDAETLMPGRCLL